MDPTVSDAIFIGDKDIWANHSTFLQFCTEVSSKSRHRNPTAKPRLLISFTNHGYFDMAYNFVVALKRLDIYNVIMFALDIPSFERLKALGIPTWLLTSRENTVYTEQSSSFGTPEFNSICNVKPWIVVECLKGGFDVVWTDTDVFWHRDSQPYFDICPDVDIQIQSDDDDICAGFFFARSTDANVKLLEKVLTYVNTCMDDQTALRRFLLEEEGFAHRLTSKPADLSMTQHMDWSISPPQYTLKQGVANYLVLPRSLFPNGTAFYNVKFPQRLGITPFIVHNNCIIGHDSKVDRFKMYHQWLIPESNDVEFEKCPHVMNPLLQLAKHREIVTCISTDPSQTTLYTAAYDKTVKVYRMDAIQSALSQKESKLKPSGGGFLNRRGGVWCMAWSLPTSDADDPPALKALQLIDELPEGFRGGLSGASRPMCFTGGHDRNVMVWNTDEGLSKFVYANQGPWTLNHTMKGHQGVINDLCFHRGVVFSASDDGTVRAWDPRKGERTRIFRAGSGWMTSVTADGPALFASSSDGCAYAWEIATARLMQVYLGHTGWIRSIVVIGAKKRVYTAGSDQSIKEWDMISGDCLRTLHKAHTGGINKLIVSNAIDGERVLYSASDDGLVRVWKLETLACLGEYQGHNGPVSALAVTNGLVFSGGLDHTVRVWKAI